MFEVPYHVIDCMFLH